MAIVHNRPNTPTAPCAGHAVIDCQRARVTARTSDASTVVAVSGEIDACNAEPVGECLRGFVAPDRVLIVDLGGLGFLGVEGLTGLFRVGTECAAAGAQWALVTSHPVRRLLRVADPERTLPAVGSMMEAAQRF